MMRETGHKTPISFAAAVGLKDSNNLYLIKAKGYISQETARRIHEAFPQYPVEWIQGTKDCEDIPEKFPIPEITGSRMVPLGVFKNLSLYDPQQNTRPDSVIYLPEELTGGAKFATYYRGETLSPRIPCGTTILLRPCSVNNLAYGAMYYVITATSRTYQVIRRGQDKEHVLLTKPRAKAYPSLQIPKKQIECLLRICGYISLDEPALK